MREIAKEAQEAAKSSIDLGEQILNLANCANTLAKNWRPLG